MAEPLQVDGPSEPTPAAGQTAPEPAGLTGTAAEPQSAPAPAPGPAEHADTGETFFDPRDVPNELQPAYKQMQAAFTKKTQAIAKDKHAVEAYNAFMANPVASLQQLASQYGYNLSQGQMTQGNQAQGNNGIDKDWQPSNWQEVFQRAEEVLKPKLRQEWEQEMRPMIDEMRRVKQTQIEKVLDDATGGEWRQYEDDMTSLLREHPTLANNPEMLARLAIPQETQQSRAYQQALKKLQHKAEAAQVSSGSTTSQQQSTPDKPMSLDEAVEWAKQDLRKRGISGPG